RAFFQKAAILFKAINRNKPFNGSAMNSPPTPPYCGSVAAALHLMNALIRCGSCRKRFCLSQGVFPVFVFHSFVQFLNINVPKTRMFLH
ncbi:MAG: hypothetical protein SOR67_09120, partial [Alloprevotella sp.]|nr:hypothetical protein [Alloprevotella sp.]